MGTIARSTKAGGSTNIADGQTAVANDVNTDMNTAYTEINGELDDANIKTAEMPGAKSFRFTEISAPSSPSSNDILLYGADNGAGITVLRVKDSAGNVTSLSQNRLVGSGTQLGRFGGVIDSDTSSVGTDANTNEKVLHSHSISANTFTTGGTTIHLVATGAFAATATNKTLRVRINGVAGTILAAIGTSVFNDRGWLIDLWLTSQGTSAIDAHGNIFMSGSDGGGVADLATSSFNRIANTALDTTAAWTLDICGLNGTANANDVTARQSRSIYYPLAASA